MLDLSFDVCHIAGLMTDPTGGTRLNVCTFPKTDCPLRQVTSLLAAVLIYLLNFFLSWGKLITIINTHIYRRKMKRMDLARDLFTMLKELRCFQFSTEIPAD